MATKSRIPPWSRRVMARQLGLLVNDDGTDGGTGQASELAYESLRAQQGDVSEETLAAPPKDHVIVAPAVAGATAGFLVGGPVGVVIGGAVGWVVGKRLSGAKPAAPRAAIAAIRKSDALPTRSGKAPGAGQPGPHTIAPATPLEMPAPSPQVMGPSEEAALERGIDPSLEPTEEPWSGGRGDIPAAEQVVDVTGRQIPAWEKDPNYFEPEPSQLGDDLGDLDDLDSELGLD